MLTRREAVKGLGAAMAGILIPQDYQMPEDMKGKRKKVRPEDIRSGTLYGQYQLRGSILTIKDASTTASGFMAFGTDMTTIPTSATTGTGIYIDYTGIYGLASDVQQAYMSAADGKIYAGAGAVTLDSTGAAVLSPTSFSDINSFKFVESDGTIDALWQHYNNATTKNESLLKLNALTGLASIFELNAAAPATKQALISLHTTSGTVDSYIQLDNTSGTSSIFRLLDDSLKAKFQVNLLTGSTIINSAALATSATDGFLYITSSAGAPSGTPTTYAGRPPIHYDSTNKRIYVYDYTAPAWNYVGIGTAGANADTLDSIDSTGFFILAGQSGGQTGIGGTGSGENLTLKSTSHATKGKIIFGAAGTTVYDEVNERWGIGTASPTQKLDVRDSDTNLTGSRRTLYTQGTYQQQTSSNFNNFAFLMEMERGNNSGITNIFAQAAGMFSANIAAGHAGTLSNVWGVASYGAVRAGATGSVGEYVGFYTLLTNGANTATMTTFTGLKIATPVLNGTSLTNLNGILIENLTAGSSNNYAIYTNSGRVHFGDSVDLSSGKNITLVAGNIITDTTTGTKIGTATTQKLGFYNATPIVQPGATTDLGTVLSNLGLRASGTAYPLTTSGSVQITGTNPFGYGSGAGGTVTQATSKSTGVTLNKTVGTVTMHNAALAAGTTVTFTLTNSTIAATDLVILNHTSGGTAGAYTLNAQVAAGSATINVRNVTAGSLSEAIVIRFAVIKGVTS